MLLQAGRRHVLAAPLLLHVAVGERLLGVHADVGHVTRWHVALGHPRPALGRQVSARGLLGRVDGIGVVHAVVASGRLGSV